MTDLFLSREEITDADVALSREWLVTNGLGGFASGTVGQANTRRYHGLLVAALRPPVDRVVMVAKLDATARYRGESFELAANEYAGGTIAPRGFERLSEFRLDGIKVDVRGNLYLSAPGGVWIFSSTGKHLGTITAPKPVHNFAWGGADGKTLYLCARSTLYRVPLLVEGVRP